MTFKVAKSLRAELLWWLMVPLGILFAFNSWRTIDTSRELANVAYDRTLQASVRTIAERVTVDQDGVHVDIPAAALEMFESQFQDRVYYSVHLNNGKLLTGYDQLPQPDRLHQPGLDRIVFFDARYKGEDVRFAIYSRPLFEQDNRLSAIVQVGETLSSRQALARQIVWDAMRDQLWMMALAAIFVVIGIQRGLRPLLTLRDKIQRRDEGELYPFNVQKVQTELQPLVVSLNQNMQRLQEELDARQRFIADASHQLRTPLTLLNTQAELALRAQEPAAMHAALIELHHSTRQTVRLANQLLSLSRAEPDSVRQLAFEPMDLTDFARSLTAEFAPAARSKQIDLGFEGEDACYISGNTLLLHELISNLLDNAIHYTPANGIVTIRVEAQHADIYLTVSDSGPGIPRSERLRVFERFYRILGTKESGCGLGLAIVKECAQAHEAVVSLSDAEEGGLKVTVRFPPSPHRHF
ncbi:sensor histidine kinase [Leeia oryzae]|uniref:sensor histidine kinase n=1 Tax=Leeia oryzae TaxID=356662 RepID=UPI0003724C9F|nr:sensor histidine kinase [Leeia oryzae]